MADERPTLESTNRLLHDLERKLSLGLEASDQTHQSHTSLVIVDHNVSGLARQSIQLSVLLYIKNNDSDFDADLVFADRQQRHVTQFAREYSPSTAAQTIEKDDVAKDVDEELFNGSFDSLDRSLEEHDDYDDYDDFGDDDDGVEVDEDDDDDMLLPPLPPRLPPREMDPDKLYGLYDFLGPDPLHCTLSRDEPVYLVNDLDNYWWLIKKMTKKERLDLGLKRQELFPVYSDEEDGKIGFVPAECLETYGERLARLNCFKNEELEKTSRDTLPLEAEEAPEEPLQAKESIESLHEGSTDSIQRSATSVVSEQEQPFTLGRTGSILKKSGSLRQSNKSVTFENLGSLMLEGEASDSEMVDFADLYYSFSHEDLHQKPTDENNDEEQQSEVLSDLYPAEMPLQINKSIRKPKKTEDLTEFQPPTYDTSSIGSFSPDTPPIGHFHNHDDDNNSTNNNNNPTLRRSLIMDRLSQVTMDIQDQMTSDEEGDNTFDFYSSYGDEEDEKAVPDEEDDAFDLDCSREENVTPLTSTNSLNNVSLSPKRVSSAPPFFDKKKPRSFNDDSPILGKLDELSEKLAELEHML